MFNTFRSKVLLSFFAFTCINVIFIVQFSFYQSEKEEIEKTSQILEENYRVLLNDFMIVSSFFYHESVNEEYYKHKKSLYVEKHDDGVNTIRKGLVKVLRSDYAEKYNLDAQVEDVFSELVSYSAIFENMRNLMFEQGFKDYGIVGEMRDYAHLIEENKYVDPADILMLRRHEKDFIIRNDPRYGEKFLSKIYDIQVKILAQKTIPKNEKDSLRVMLNGYLLEFEKLQSINKQFGFKTNTGLKEKLDLSQENLAGLFESTLAFAHEKEKALKNQLYTRFLILIVVVVLLSIFLAFYISRKMTSRLSEIMKGMSLFVESGFEQKATNLNCFSKDDEIGRLIENYKIIEQKVSELVWEFRRKVDERTQEVVRQKEKIEFQNEEIKAQRDELYRQNAYIEEQKDLVDRQNSEILDSFRYAAGIQQSLMPSQERVDEIFSQNFMFYRPLDIISGDYYWTHRINSNGMDLSFFVVADCTGHGVPGAMMSMLGMSCLNELIIRQKNHSVKEILHLLRENIKSAMLYRKAIAKAYDGMDIALGIINNTTGELTFGGANRNLYICKRGEMSVLKGDKMPIGHFLGEEKSFSETKFQLHKGDCIYAFSDGYPDQFGGEKNKKFTTKRLMKFINELSSKDMKSQLHKITEQYDSWKGSENQIDDVLVMGIRWDVDNERDF